MTSTNDMWACGMHRPEEAGVVCGRCHDDEVERLRRKIATSNDLLGSAVRACDKQAREAFAFAKYIVSHADDRLPDHACAQCVPGGSLVSEGFVCVYHRALAATSIGRAALQSADKKAGAP